MNDFDDGGPAFPFDEYTKDGQQYKVHLGMTLRDWFAGQAMAGIDWLNSCNSYETDVAACYDMAEQMIKERNARNK